MKRNLPGDGRKTTETGCEHIATLEEVTDDMTIYRNRAHAGRELGGILKRTIDEDRWIVLALPRGGVEVAAEVANVLDAPLDVLLVRKLTVPPHNELAIGAIASGGVRVLNDRLIEELGLPRIEVDAITAREEMKLKEREFSYAASPPDVVARTAIIVDDGLATGATMRAAVIAAQELNAGKVVSVVPVASDEAVNLVKDVADEVICPKIKTEFASVGQWYDDFNQVTDIDVLEILRNSSQYEIDIQESNSSFRSW